MQTRTAMVTGANDGIGKATALGLAKQGFQVVMVCRNAAKGQAARDEICQAAGNPNVEVMLCDLSSQAQIRRLADEYQRTHTHLHVLINNAGVNVQKRTVTAESIELNFAVNYLAAFLLTVLMLDTLKASAPARIVNMSSSAERFDKIDFDDLMTARNYTWMRAYARARLATVLFTYELSRRLAGTGVTVNTLNPGVVKTKITNEVGGFFAWMAWLATPFAKTPEQGAETSLYLAASPDVEGITGKYFENKRAKATSKASYDEALARRLWDVSAKLAHLESAATT